MKLSHCNATLLCKSESKNFEPPKNSKSDLNFCQSANMFLDSFGTSHKLKQNSRISRSYRFIGHNPVTDIAWMCVYLCPHVAVREHLAYSEQFINMMGNNKYSDKFWTPRHLLRFWTFFSALDFGLDTIL